MNFSDSSLKITRRKLPHWELDGSIYFITFNTYKRLELNPSARQIVLNCCLFFDESRHQHDRRYHTFAIVIMPDHVHWLMQPFPKSNGEYWSIGSILHSVKSYSAKQIPKVMNHSGIVWHEERYDRIMRNEEEFLNTWQYIRENPVKENLANIPEEYPFFWQETYTG
ncbi:REP-associated tyrosine transposase [Geminocystis herdmanii]|uniref:REP-associated tyrosine transposase n=1 Tax=Geminocystis herdmanii TaxID=669359 RepID=UPI00034AB1E2|nr:transposase [Geminocystis herdmanii]